MASHSIVLTTREAAAFLGTHIETVRRLARRGDIPAFKVGKDWRSPKDALQRWTESPQPGAQRPGPIAGGAGQDLAPIRDQKTASLPTGVAGQPIMDSLAALRRYLAGSGDAGRGQDPAPDSAARAAMIAGPRETPRSLFRTVTGYIKEWLGCDAVAIRLRVGSDFPYYETRGFSQEFVLAENLLCASDSGEDLPRDRAGNPTLECMCGAVIRG